MQKHIDLRLGVGIHPAQLYHQQLLLEIGPHVERRMMCLIADEEQQTDATESGYRQSDILDPEPIGDLGHQSINREGDNEE